ncbi:glycosyltransferase [Methanobacterium alcaliphilum]|uniref:glycosyltransferase n=1 Tax=Methanobacterium alcaliphilum TaxID=392018 RepID=UPI00200AED5B|nr:glycosyltransferase [Methanobacterium alcaliphilum]MCK9151113.1 glycosyltransferase [Methanobacterium alcaliphilum]
MSCLILIIVFLLMAAKNNGKSGILVSVVIPAYNEENTVANVVKIAMSSKYVHEVLVVDDGSTDNTYEVAKVAGASIIRHTNNHGKGAALKTGFKHSKGDIIAFIDADLKDLSTKQVENIIRPIIEGKADITKTKFKREAGRVTELTAKPLLDFFFPEIKFDQPLSGQFAAKRTALTKIRFEEDYGVDVGIVLDADVLGLNIREVDIGEIQHQMSTLSDLNLVANEVVRTIVDRAIEYGRVTMMDSMGKSIRMGILGLSLASLGVFGVFFIRFVPSTLWIIVSIIGMIMAVYYILKLIKRSYHVLLRQEGRIQSVKSFTYMHFPILVSGLILIAMLSTLLGAVHVDEGKISIEPNSGNLIIWKSNTENRTFDVRGPYEVDSALENENTLIRISKEALDTLGLQYGDKVYIHSESYTLNETRPGETNILRIPLDARKSLDISIGEVIQDSNLRKIFNGIYAQKNLALLENITNVTILNGYSIQNDVEKSYMVDIFLDKKKVSTTNGIFKKGAYSIYVDGEKVKTIQIGDKVIKDDYYIYWENHIIKIQIGNESTSDMRFIPAEEGRFLSIRFEE